MASLNKNDRRKESGSKAKLDRMTEEQAATTEIFYWNTIVVQLLSHVRLFCDSHELQHTRLPCPSPFSGACSNSCPLSW